MSNYREFVGKNVEKALEAASKSLNLPKEKIKHDVISFGSSGIFGLVGVKKAKIRVALPEGGGSNGKRGAGSGASSATSAAVQDILSSTFGDAGTKKGSGSKEKAVKKAPKRESAPKRERGSAGGGGPKKEAAPKKAQESQRTPAPKKDESQPPNVKTPSAGNGKPVDPEIIDYGSSILQGVVDYLTDDAVINVDQNDERTIYNITGGNAAVLIGKRGQTLEAIQYLLEKIVNKKNGGRVRVLVDVEGYLDTRKENLERLAGRLSEKAVRVGKPMTIGQMNAHDRRIVHLCLKENTNVRTQSIGEGYYRKLMIFPKKRRRNNR